MNEECIDRTKSAVERVAMVGAKVILTGSLMIGVLSPEYEGVLHPTDIVAMAPVVHGKKDALYRSGAIFIAPIHAEDGAMVAMPTSEHGGLHDHREGRSIEVKLTSPIIVSSFISAVTPRPGRWFM